MKNFNTNFIYTGAVNLFAICILFLFINSCTSAKYTNYKSFQYSKKEDKQTDHQELGDKAKTENPESFVGKQTVEIQEPVKTKATTGKKVAQPQQKKISGAAKLAVKVVSKSLDPLKVSTKASRKIQSIIKGKQDIAKVNKTFEFSLVKLFWTIFAIALIIWLLGFLFGNLGNLIHIMLVVALVFLILALLPD